MLVAGCSGSGKTTLTSKLVARCGEVMTRKPSRVIVFYTHMQEAYVRLGKKINKRGDGCPVKLLSGPEHFTADLTTAPGTLLIVDDMQATHAAEVASWFTRKAHHNDSSIVYLVQNVFDKTPAHRTISLNATYIVLFKNPRDASQVSHLDRQVYPGSGGLLTAAYRDATENSPYSYIVIDFNQSTPESFRLRNTLFPIEDFPHAYAYVAAEKTQ